MSFDLFQSRRNYNYYCEYWTRAEDSKPEFIELERIPDGHFTARIVSQVTQREQFFGSTFMHSQENLQLETRDKVPTLKAEDVIKFQDHFWRVNSVQTKPARIQMTEFQKNDAVSYTTVIEIRK